MIGAAPVVFAGSQSRVVDYLPREETLQYVKTASTYTRSLSGISCSAANDLLNKKNRCEQCMQLKSQCPDCCLNSDYTALKCSAADDPALYSCTSDGRNCAMDQIFASPCAAAFNCPGQSQATNCATNDIPYCVELGCPSGEPAVPSGNHCVRDTLDSTVWICKHNDPDARPKIPCVFKPNTVPDCAALSDPAYTIAEVSCPAALPGSKCYAYRQTPALTTCLSACTNFARAQERYKKNVYCCQKDVCCAQMGCRSVGYIEHCSTDTCRARVNWAECQPATLDPELCCNRLTPDRCAEWVNELTACAQGGVNGACSSCYREIDSSFNYSFVAKSNEKMVIIWGAEASPSYTPSASPSPNTFFYTLVKVIQADTGAVVHQSITHESTFANAFSILSSTVVNGADVFYPGKRYYVRLYYFMPVLNGYTLSTTVSSMELIVLRIRE